MEQAINHKKIHTYITYTDAYMHTRTRRKVYLEKLIVPRAVNKFPIFYRTGKFIAVFTVARYWTLS